MWEIRFVYTGKRVSDAHTHEHTNTHERIEGFIESKLV